VATVNGLIKRTVRGRRFGDTSDQNPHAEGTLAWLEWRSDDKKARDSAARRGGFVVYFRDNKPVGLVDYSFGKAKGLTNYPFYKEV